MSAFGCLLGSVTAGARLMFALSRDGFGPRRLSKVSSSGAPTAAVLTAVLFGLTAVLLLHGIAGKSISETYFFWGTIGSLLVLVAYAVTSVGAIKLCLRQERPTKWLEVALISAGVAFIGYVLYKSCYPVPDFPANLLPYIAGGWLLIGLLSVVASPRLAERIGKSLAVEEGFDSKAHV